MSFTSLAFFRGSWGGPQARPGLGFLCVPLYPFVFAGIPTHPHVVRCIPMHSHTFFCTPTFPQVLLHISRHMHAILYFEKHSKVSMLTLIISTQLIPSRPHAFQYIPMHFRALRIPKQARVRNCSSCSW